jgi:hypothetical protein
MTAFSSMFTPCLFGLKEQRCTASTEFGLI